MAKILALLLVVSVVTVVIVAIRVYGDQKVIAFGTAMSFIAASGAAFAAWRYLEKTAEVVQVTRDSVLQQARVAKIMEADLRFRIAPNLQFRAQGGSTADLPAEIENVGRGVAVNTVGAVTYVPTNRQQLLQLDNWIEPNKPVRIRIGQQPTESSYTVELSCSDSVGLNKYIFRLDQNGRNTVAVEPLVDLSGTQS